MLYDSVMSAELREGDCVWDVGANVGHYTRFYSAAVGTEGSVYAFEPSPINFERLSAACADLANVTAHCLGLGRSDGSISFLQGEDELGATSRIVAPGTGAALDIEVLTGSTLIERRGVETPNVVKIDVEGYELDVLQGLGEHISSDSLRAIGIEVHFGLLAERGMSHAPQQIERLLKQSGYSVQWPDSSHIVAKRA